MDTTDLDDVVRRSLGDPLAAAGYVEHDLTWAWRDAGAFVALSAVPSTTDEAAAYSIRVGWRYDALGDPEPEPPLAHGCVRSLTLDELVGRSGLPLAAVGRPSEASVADFQQRLATVMRKHLMRWMESWKRPEGFRDFLSHKELHLAAAWASALLGHDERARLEIGQAAHLHGRPLDEAFDRQRADLDEAFVAPWAARHGLAAELAEAPPDVVGAFGSAPGALARDRVLEPGTEHRRLQTRHATYARLCLRLLGASSAL